MKWEKVKLGDVSKPGQYGSGAAASEFKEGLPRYIRITDIDEDGNLKVDKVSLNTNEWKDYILEEGDLLFARSGATVGKTYLSKKQDGLCVYAGYLIRFQVDQTKLDPTYLFHFTHSSEYKHWVAARQNVVAQPNINANTKNKKVSYQKYFYALFSPNPQTNIAGVGAFYSSGVAGWCGAADIGGAAV